uniref:Uncharacterized protein n=1 Tax=Anguilla anguilla TaxID=7936 RepID=A0A0E9PGW6_ANGAN
MPLQPDNINNNTSLISPSASLSLVSLSAYTRNFIWTCLKLCWASLECTLCKFPTNILIIIFVIQWIYPLDRSFLGLPY